MSLPAKHKRGATFERVGQIVVLDENAVALPDLTGWTGRCTIKTAGGALVDEAQFTWIDASSCMAKISVADTTNWPICTVELDILLKSPAGDWVPTWTASMIIEKAITSRWLS